MTVLLEHQLLAGCSLTCWVSKEDPYQEDTKRPHSKGQDSTCQHGWECCSASISSKGHTIQESHSKSQVTKPWQAKDSQG
jgi:hypothetical protein